MLVYQIIMWIIVAACGIALLGFFIWAFDGWRDLFNNLCESKKRDRKNQIVDLLAFCVFMEDKGGILHKSTKFIVAKYNQFIARDSSKQKINVHTLQSAKDTFLAQNSPEWANTVWVDKELVKKVKQAIK